MSSRSLRLPLAVLAAVLLVACADGVTPSQTPQPSPTSTRIAAIRAARLAVAGPAVDLAEATAEVRAAIDQIRAAPPDDPGDRLVAIDAVRGGFVASLDRAVTAAQQVALGTDVSEVVAAADAWGEAVRAGQDAGVAARADLDVLADVTTVDRELAALVATWDVPGARSEQLARLDATATTADELAGGLERKTDVAACLTTYSRRAEAARTVAARTRELRALVESRRGEDFDAQREAFDDDPFGVPLAAGDAAEVACWRADAPIHPAETSLRGALDDLEAALND